MTVEQDPTPGPIVTVARDLTAIEHLDGQLEAQAVARANDRTLPGGDAMVALAPDADLEEWAARIDAAERWHYATCTATEHRDCTIHGAEHVADQDDQDHEDPLATLRWWSDERRERYGFPLGGRTPTLTSEAGFLRWALDGMWRDEPRWDDFAADVRRAKVRLENLLHAGERAERGAPCLYDECRGVRLVRKLEPYRDEAGAKAWRLTDWHCPRCHRTWDDDAYHRMVTAANEAAKVEQVAGETWCSLDYAARHVERPVATIRVWKHRGMLATVCLRAGRRRDYVRLADVIEQDQRARRRDDVA